MFNVLSLQLDGNIENRTIVKADLYLKEKKKE